MAQHRIGIDLGGTKIEIVALEPDGRERLRRRIATPTGGYDATLAAIADLVHALDRDLGSELGGSAPIGLGIPGTISPASGLVKNANSTALNGRPLDRDLASLLGRPVRAENDANCFALSEATDGAGVGCGVVFGVILGTGCGGGIVIDRAVMPGRHRIAGEWGHNPLPWPTRDESPGPACWCGRFGCLEAWLSGPALARASDGTGASDASALPARAAAGDGRAQAALDQHAERLARGLAHVVNLLDPDCIVLGGGLSNMEHLYARLPELMGPLVFSDRCDTPILRNRHGDASGVRGAARLWPLP